MVIKTEVLSKDVTASQTEEIGTFSGEEGKKKHIIGIKRYYEGVGSQVGKMNKTTFFEDDQRIWTSNKDEEVMDLDVNSGDKLIYYGTDTSASNNEMVVKIRYEESGA